MPQIVGIHTNPQKQVSSDTMSFVLKTTAIDPNVDSIGTYNWYLYNINTDTYVLQTSAPTQTTSSMNVNGFQMFSRAFNTAGTAGQPNRVQIFIGKGLKTKQVDFYTTAGKTNPLGYDRFLFSTNLEAGAIVYYNELTGVLTIDVGSNWTSTITARQITYDEASNPIANGYFVFNASKF